MIRATSATLTALTVSRRSIASFQALWLAQFGLDTGLGRRLNGCETMTDPTPKQLAMARRIAKKIANEPDGAYSNEVYLGALAAIIETSERIAKLADQHSTARFAAKDAAIARRDKREARDHESMAIQAVHIATAIRKGDHLDV